MKTENQSQSGSPVWNALHETTTTAVNRAEQNSGANTTPVILSECAVCDGRGYMFDPMGAGRSKGAFVVCECMQAITLCDGNPPYDYYDREKNAMLPCPSKPARLALARIQFLFRKSGIPVRFEGQFIMSLYNQTQVKIDSKLRKDGDEELAQRLQSWQLAADAALFMILDYMEKGDSRGIYLYGETGCGKTLLSCAALNEMIVRYQANVKYAKISRDVLGKLRASFNPNSDFYGEGRKIEEELATVSALVIDDFGVHRESDWVNSVLYDLIDARYENNLLTIITSNEPMDAWKEISGGRVYSRLRQMCTECHIDAPDYRLDEKVAL